LQGDLMNENNRLVCAIIFPKDGMTANAILDRGRRKAQRSACTSHRRK